MRVLALDIENSYLLCGAWSLWDQNINLDRLFDFGKVLCYAAKWVGEKEMFFGRHDDKDFLESIHALLDEADVVLTFNGSRHDVPMLNREFVKAGMSPPSPYKQIDLYKTVKKQFKFPSNKLQHISSELQIGQKVAHAGFGMWVKCLQGDEAAWKMMERYNKQDVNLLIRLYKLLRPWVDGHPNHNLYGKTGVCVHCGGKHLQKRGTYKTQTAIYTRLHCQSCGAWSRTRYSEVDKEVRESIYTGVSLS